jgi:Ser/Thr protein kinase RdoA (MazF antagonist)
MASVKGAQALRRIGDRDGGQIMSPHTVPRFEVADAVRAARGKYGLSAEARPLPSERDQNFALEDDAGGKFVLKIAKSDEERSVLELQNAALKHAARHAPDLALQRLVATPQGEDIVTITSPQGQSYFLRLMTWLEGEIFVHARPHDAVLLESLGSTMAELDLALQGFSHPAMHRELHWDVKRADLALQYLPLLSESQQAIVRRFMNAWERVEWRALRHSVIHGDANDYNVLVREGRVAGLLDFGDIVHSATACDLAIALAYAMLDKAEPLAAALPVIRAYHTRFPLTDAEAGALFSLTAARLCLSVCYAAHNAQAKRGDAYQLVTAGPAWVLLQQLNAVPWDVLQNSFRNACAPI